MYASYLLKGLYWANKTNSVNSKTEMMSSKLLFIGTKLKER